MMRAHEFTQLAEEELDEGWKDTVAHLGMLGFLAGAGTVGLTVKQAMTDPDIPDTKKAVLAVKADIPSIQLPPAVAAKIPAAKEIIAQTPELKQTAPVKHDDHKLFAPISNKHPKIQAITNQPTEIMLKNFAESQGIVGIELAAFLAQCAHETLNYTKMIEMAGGSKYEPLFKKDKQGKLIVDPKTRQPINFNRDAAKLGNIHKGDGERFKGRGFIQLTGRDNYRMASLAIFGDNTLLEKGNEFLAADPKIAARIAVWYWQNRVKPKVTDFKDIKAVTHPINAGLAGIESRNRIFNNYLQTGRT